MITATSSIDGPPITINATVSGLAIYLDTWAVIDLAEGDPSRRRRFIDSLHCGADLLFSLANAAELAGQRGQSVNIVRTFLDEIGPHWLPVELNPFKVVERELKGMGSDSCISSDFMKAYFKNRLADYSPNSGKVIDLSKDFFRLGAVLDWVAKSESLPKQSKQFDEVLKPINKYRTAYKRNPSRLDQKCRTFNPSRPATFTCYNLLKILIRESRVNHVKKGDGLDFCHAVMAGAFASVATLDKHWKRRVEGLPKPNKLALIYSGRELDKMVTDIESLVKQQGPHRWERWGRRRRAEL